MKAIKISSCFFSVCLLAACGEADQSGQEPIKSVDIKKDIINNEDTVSGSELALLKKIAQNCSDPKDRLGYLAEKAGGITIESLGEETWIINMWYGGSYEDIFVYTATKTGTYHKVLSLSGVISFTTQEKTDHGLKRFQVQNNRNKQSVVFQYNGTDYSRFLDNGITKSLEDTSGVNTLQRMEIYTEK